MKPNFERSIWGILIVIFGVLLLGDNLNIVTVDVWDYVWKFWPIFIIIPGLKAIQQRNYFWGTAMVVGGIAFIYSNFTNIDLWGVIWAGMIISFGLSLLFKPKFSEKDMKNSSNEDYIADSVVFGGLEKMVTSKNFKGGTIEAVFSGAEIDLRKMELGADYVVIDVSAVFGGVEIQINTENYKVVSNGTGIFGGWSNKFPASQKDKPVLEIKGAAVFGAVEIKA